MCTHTHTNITVVGGVCLELSVVNGTRVADSKRLLQHFLRLLSPGVPRAGKMSLSPPTKFNSTSTCLKRLIQCRPSPTIRLLLASRFGDLVLMVDPCGRVCRCVLCDAFISSSTIAEYCHHRHFLIQDCHPDRKELPCKCIIAKNTDDLFFISEGQ